MRNRYEALYGSPVHWFRAYLQALGGDHSTALQTAADLDKQIAQGQALPIDTALVHVALGDAEGALLIIEQSNEASVSFQLFLWPEYKRLW